MLNLAVWVDFNQVVKSSFKKSECLNYLIHNANPWLFRLIFRFWKNQPLEGVMIPEIRLHEIKFRLRKKYFRLREFKKREGESFKQIVSWPNSSSTFSFSSSTFLNSCWNVGWFFYFSKIRHKSQELTLIINILGFADFLKDVFILLLNSQWISIKQNSQKKSLKNLTSGVQMWYLRHRKHKPSKLGKENFILFHSYS